MLPLGPGTVAGFSEMCLRAVAPLGIGPLRTTRATEVPGAAPLDGDREERPDDLEQAQRVWAALARAGGAFGMWQAPYRGHRRVGPM